MAERRPKNMKIKNMKIKDFTEVASTSPYTSKYPPPERKSRQLKHIRIGGLDSLRFLIK